jgi:hypothetical protein
MHLIDPISHIYLSQVDNVQRPSGTCNNTSVCMAATAQGLPTHTSRGEQVEDCLFGLQQDYGYSRHAPISLATSFEKWAAAEFPELGLRDVLNLSATWEDVRASLQQGYIVVIHGWFTQAGHIIAITGETGQGWIVSDPWGEWFSSGYKVGVSAKNLIYSHALMERTCGPDGTMWIHSIQGKTKPHYPPLLKRHQENKGIMLQCIYNDGLSFTEDCLEVAPTLIWQIQNRLEFTGFSPGKTDSIWGPKTRMALEQFAAKLGLPALPLEKALAEALIEAQAA